MPTPFEFLKSLETFSTVPDESMHWMLETGEIRKMKEGDFLFEAERVADELFIILEGTLRVFGTQNNEQREFTRQGPGDITGVLPYSRMTHARGNGQFLDEGKVFVLHRKDFDEMISDHYCLTRSFVHVMTNRVRSFTTFRQQNEKLMALGKLSAGLAHELNNPASAIVRSAETLKQHLQLIPEKFKAVISIKMKAEEVDAVNDLMFRKVAAGVNNNLGLSERMEREEAVLDWLEAKGLEDADELAEHLVDYNFSDQDLELIAANVPESHFSPVIRWVENNLSTEKMVGEIADAAHRIADLVSAVKGYSHMDRSLDRGKVNVHDGLNSTVRMLDFKFRKANIQLEKDFSSNLPEVMGFPGELNQVWTNLIDNAIDALGELEAEENPVLTLRTRSEKGRVVVEIEDSGPGIPEDVLERIFDPFYTTKAVGKGTGLGLDIVQKIVQQHRGRIFVESVPGMTKFRVVLPVE